MNNKHRKRNFTPSDDTLIREQPVTGIGLKTLKTMLRVSPLPKNLQSAIRYLDDDQLDRLLAAVLAEQRRRGKKVPVSDKSPRKALVKVAAPPLPQGKLNAIRAAFKAGFTPSRIARQFRISQSDVKKALASDEMKR